MWTVESWTGESWTGASWTDGTEDSIEELLEGRELARRRLLLIVFQLRKIIVFVIVMRDERLYNQYKILLKFHCRFSN